MITEPIRASAKLAIAAVMAAVVLAVPMPASPASAVDEASAAYKAAERYPELTISYPENETIFPPEIAPCTFSWRETGTQSDTWVVLLEFSTNGAPLRFLSQQPEWTPARADWETIKERSRGRAAAATVLGFERSAPSNILSCGRVRFTTSVDEVGAPLFYREVNLPFASAVANPSRIRWRFGSLSSPEPPRIVLEHLPVCGNCHSFSKDGGVMGMDVDYANNKGSYVITRVGKEMTLPTSDIITWDEYKRQDGQMTFGLLSQVSPDGQVVVSTVKDKSVFVPRPELAYSQLFFPVKGILATYRRNSGTFQSLPGADDPTYVQSNPAWSPDGKQIVFARTKAYQLNKSAEGKLLLSEADCAEFLHDGKPFRFDLYRIPYNDGQGGEPEPVAGASRNGRSNYFPKYSPDGRWIVFCQATNYMLLQPDSELYIIPAAGGEARRLRCNGPRMNSWHSWSPNGRWLVFSSKRNSAYTQLFLTHIDDRGESSPAVLLPGFTAPDRAANIPEFVNTAPDAIVRIREQFLDDYSHVRAAFMSELYGDQDNAIAEYRRAIEINPASVHAHQRLGALLYNVKRQFDEGFAETTEALRLDPGNGFAHYDMAMILRHRRNLDEAARHFAEAVKFSPTNSTPFYSATEMHCSLGEIWLAQGRIADAADMLARAVALNDGNGRAHYYLALALAAQQQFDSALSHYTTARSLQPEVDSVPELHFLFSGYFAQTGRTNLALASARKALALAEASGNTNLTQTVKARLGELNAPSKGK